MAVIQRSWCNTSSAPGETKRLQIIVLKFWIHGKETTDLNVTEKLWSILKKQVDKHKFTNC